MNKLYSILIAFCLIQTSWAQTKIVLDSKIEGLYCHDSYDLGDYGYVLAFNKNKQTDMATSDDKPFAQTLYYYSKDLTQKAIIKITTTGVLHIYANKNHLLLIDQKVNLYDAHLYDYTGREWYSKKIDLTAAGLNQSMVNSVQLAPNSHLLVEVYDAREELHLFENNLSNKADLILQEVDVPYSSNNPLASMASTENWKLLASHMGYYMFYRRGSNSAYDPNAVAFHLAFYDETWGLFKELLIDNILLPGERLLGKEASLSLNTTLQTFNVSCIMKKNGQLMVLVACYGLDPSSNVLQLFWRKEVPLINNTKYQLVMDDGISVPLPPTMRNRGGRMEVSIQKARTSVSEEAVNQLLCFNAQGDMVFNQLQMGNYTVLNLDGYCVDNQNMYSRIKSLQMNATLKSFCESSNCEVLGIDLDDKGAETMIMKEQMKHMVTLYHFKAK